MRSWPSKEPAQIKTREKGRGTITGSCQCYCGTRNTGPYIKGKRRADREKKRKGSEAVNWKITPKNSKKGGYMGRKGLRRVARRKVGENQKDSREKGGGIKRGQSRGLGGLEKCWGS